MNMDFNHQEALQRKMYKVDTDNRRLLQENKRLRQTVQSLTNELKDISNSNLNKSISSIIGGINHSGSIMKVEELEHHIQSLTFQLTRYKQINRDLQVVIAQVNQKLSQTLVNQAENQMEIQCLKHKIQQDKVREDCHLKRITFINDQNNRINEQKRQLRKQKNELQALLKEESKKNRQTLISLAQSLRFFTKIQSVASVNNVGNFQELQQVIDLQQQQLQQRNNELHKLRSVCQGQKRLPQQDNLRNTIKHLKLEICNYKKIIKDYTLKMSFTEKIINKYSVAAENCQKELQASARLQEELLKQRLQNQKLNKNIQECYSQIVQKEQKHNNLKNKLIQLLIENQACHYLLYENLGQNFKQMINNYVDTEKEKYKHIQKNQIQKWCSIQELIDVNLLLRQRLKI